MQKEIIIAEEKAVAVVNESSPIAIMQMVLSQGGDLVQFEKMMELQERWEANEAKKAYHQAMAAFKAEPLRIVKDKHVSFKTQKGETSYDHATLGKVTEIIGAGLGKHGLSASWKTEQTQAIKVTCTITHKLGYSESNSLTGPADTSGTKNSIQAMGSTITYLERYTLLALTGLATHDQDDDGKTEAITFIDEKQKSQIVDMMAAADVDVGDFLKYLEVKVVDEIQSKAFTSVINDLNAVVAQQKKVEP